MLKINFSNNISTFLWGLNTILAVAIFATDIIYPSAIAIHTLYITIIWLALWLPKTRHIVFFAIVGIILTILGYYWTPHNNSFWENIINRIITILVIWITTAFAIYRKITTTALEINEQKQRAILDASIDPILVLGKNQLIQSASKSIELLFGWKLHEIIGQEFYFLLAEPFATQYRKYFEDLGSLNIKSPLNTKSEFLGRHKNDFTFPCEISIAKINDNLNNEHFFSIGLRDIGERKQFEEKLIWLSMHDELTGIFNRRYFNKQINTEWNRLMRIKSPLALIILDIDDFKKYNDTLGHQEGDRCLKMIANVTCSVINRAGDFAARYGGEEFVLLMPYTDSAGLLHIAKKIQDEIKTLRIEHPYAETGEFLTVSMGLSSMVPIHACTTDVLIKQADYALYKAKNSGKNCYNLYTDHT
jgi:diguanylate cyclase (GGDEF)-like protein/PAS domain S-box-containing protein